MPKKPFNTGVILTPPGERDWHFGGVSGGAREVLVEDGQWDKFLPVFEAQARYGLETMSCVSQSLCNCLEIYFKAAFDRVLNFSDRFLATISETTKRGNTLQKVGLAAHKQGLSDEETWPWTKEIDTWDEYYGPIPEKARESAMRFVNKWETFFEWVEPRPETMIEALKYGPLQLVSGGHAYVGYGYDPGNEWKIFDTYDYKGADGAGTRTLPWNHQFLAAMMHTAVNKEGDELLLELNNDTLVFEGGGPGRLGLHINGKLFVDDSAKIIGQWITRNGSESGTFVGGPVRTIPMEEFIRFPMTDLKGNPLN